MKLHVTEWGEGPRTAVLIHGITSEGATWGRVAPRLAERGYRVLAPSLRGHGPSPRGEYDPDGWASDLVETLDPQPDLAIGHSLGGIAVLLAAPVLRPGKAVYEDPAWFLGGGPHREQIAQGFAAQKGWSREQVAAANPRWPDADVDAKLAALQSWDPETVHWIGPEGRDFTPDQPPVGPSLVVLSDPSELVPPAHAERLAALGWEVRTVPGAGHSIHRDDLEGFLAALDGWV